MCPDNVIKTSASAVHSQTMWQDLIKIFKQHRLKKNVQKNNNVNTEAAFQVCQYQDTDIIVQITSYTCIINILIRFKEINVSYKKKGLVMRS